MAITNMIPAVWSARILEKLQENLVYAQPGVVNRDYEGDIREAGDRVHIHSFADLTISNYVKNSTTIAYEQLTDSRVTLIIDQSKYFAFRVDDIDRVQMKPDLMDAAAGRAAYQLAEVADGFVAGLINGGVPAGNQIAVTQGTSASIYGKFVNLARRMDDALLPQEGRFAVISPFVKELLLQNADFLNSQPDAVLNGEVGRIAGIRLLLSNNVPVDGTPADDHHVLAGVPSAVGYAEQISQVEGLRLENSFSDAVRGLHLYGAKVLDANRLFDLRLSVA